MEEGLQRQANPGYIDLVVLRTMRWVSCIDLVRRGGIPTQDLLDPISI